MHSESLVTLSGDEADGEDIVVSSRPSAPTTSHTPTDSEHFVTMTCTECGKAYTGNRLRPELASPDMYSMCVDCGIALHEEPRSILHSSDRKIFRYDSEGPPRPPTHAPTVEFQNRILTDQEALQAIHFFPLLARTRCMKSGSIQGKDLNEILEDAIQMSLGTSAEIASASSTVPTAMMAMRLPTS